jgi:hypothetical protein
MTRHILLTVLCAIAEYRRPSLGPAEKAVVEVWALGLE